MNVDRSQALLYCDALARGKNASIYVPSFLPASLPPIDFPAVPHAVRDEYGNTVMLQQIGVVWVAEDETQWYPTTVPTPQHHPPAAVCTTGLALPGPLPAAICTADFAGPHVPAPMMGNGHPPQPTQPNLPNLEMAPQAQQVAQAQAVRSVGMTGLGLGVGLGQGSDKAHMHRTSSRRSSREIVAIGDSLLNALPEVNQSARATRARARAGRVSN